MTGLDAFTATRATVYYRMRRVPGKVVFNILEQEVTVRSMKSVCGFSLAERFGAPSSSIRFERRELIFLRRFLSPFEPSTRRRVASGVRRSMTFTLIELLVIVAILMILMSLLMPALQSAKETANGALCLNNEKQLHLGWGYYNHDHDFLLPVWAGCDRFNSNSVRVGCWPAIVGEYLNMKDLPDDYWGTVPNQYKNGTAMSCPSFKNDVTTWNRVWEAQYGIPYYNMGGFNRNTYEAYKKMIQIKRPSEKIVFVDSFSGDTFYGGMLRIDQVYSIKYAQYRHRNRCNGVYADGHADPFNRTKALGQPWETSPMWGWD